jgi:hypothetical protein
MLPSKDIIDKLTKDALYKEASSAFAQGDNKKGIELLSKLGSDSEKMKDLKDFYKQNDTKIKSNLKDVGLTIIDKNEPIPEGYNRNSFTDKTCITTQPKDLPEWKDITAVVRYNNEIVYEDHYTIKLTTMCALNDIKSKHSGAFVGEIITSSDIKNTVQKFKKNSLYLIINELNITLSNITFDVLDLLIKFLDIESLDDVNVIHNDKIYDNDEKKKLKIFFMKTKWKQLKINTYELTK